MINDNNLLTMKNCIKKFLGSFIMKIFMSSWLKIFFAIVLCAVPFFVVEYSFSMEGAIIERLAGEALITEGAAEGIARTASESFGFSAEEMAQEGLSASVRDALGENLTQGFEKFEKALAKFKTGEIGINELKQQTEMIFSQQKDAFLEGASSALEKQGSLNVFDKGLLEGAGRLSEGELSKLPEVSKVLQGGVKLEGEGLASVNETLIKSEVRDLAKTELGGLERSGASETQLSSAESKLNTAEKAAVADRQVRAGEAQKNVDVSKTELESAKPEEKPAAQDKLDEATKAKEADERITYSEEHANAKTDLEDAKITKNNADVEKNLAQKEVEAAKEAAKKAGPQDEAAKAKVNEAEENLKSKTADYEAATEKVNKAKADLIEKENQLLKKSDIFKNKWEKTKVIGTKSGRAAWEGVKGLPASAWTQIKFVLDQFVISILFGAPNMVIEGYNSAMAKKKLLETKRNYQRWGNTWLKIPDFFINDEDPANSLNLYVGVPNEGYPITENMLDAAHYYVVKSDYTPWGSSSIFDNISDMVNLNTGFVFVSDGQAVNQNDPIFPWIDPKGGDNGLIPQINSLSGKARAGLKTEGIEYYVDSYEAGYKGNIEVGNLFANLKTGFPRLLVPTMKALQEGTTFGVDAKGKALYLVQGFRGFKSDTDNGKTIMAALSDTAVTSAPAAADDKNYIIDGIYIYQTKDTPIVDLVKKQIAADDPEKQLLLDSIVDYVVMLDPDNNVVPLMSPQPMVLPPGSNDSAFVHYALNPQIGKMKSLVDGSSKAYTASGALEEAPFPQISPATEIANQISAMQTFFNQKIKYGPFKYNGTTLTIDKALADANIYVYKASGFLEGGFDDYFVALLAPVKDEKTSKTKFPVASLPSNGIVYFVSLVTSRFYDKDLQPYAPPVAPTLKDYYITKEDSVNKIPSAVATGKPEDTSLPQAKASLYTLFVQGEYNPSPKPANYVGSLPVPPYWALNSSMFSLQGVSPLADALAQQQPLYNAIKAAHENWISVLDIDDPGALSRKMGPFEFTTGEVENIHLRALNEPALKLGYYIYTSGRYPDEYLVVSKNAAGTEGVGEEFGGQQYLVSLSNGNVYDAQSNGNVAGKPIMNLDQLVKQLELTNAGVDARIANEQKTLNALMKLTQADATMKAADKKTRIATINAQIAAIPAQKTTLYDMVSTIKQSQVGYNRAMINKLYSDDLVFGARQLYLPKESYLAGQYIYADVTGLGSPLDANGQEIKAVVDQIKDYYVTYEEDKDSATGESIATFAYPLNKNTTRIFSLVSGGGFDRSGAFAKSYQTVQISDKDGQKVYSDLNDFVTKIFTIIKARMDEEKRPQTSIVLLSRIQPLLDAQYEAVKEELKKIAEAKKNSLDEYPSKAPLATNLFMDSLPYVQRSPALVPLYLKKLTGAEKYYLVVPPTSDPESDEGIKYELNRTFIDYDIGQDHTGPNAKGMMYDRNGKPLQLLTGWILNTMRAYAGLIVDGSGKQSLGIGIEHPSFPLTVKTKDGKTQNTMIDTGIKASDPKATNVQFTFFYNTQIDNYFAQIKATSSTYFIDLTAGYGYNLDGTPRWYEAPVYIDTTGDVLLVGTDTFGLKKVAFRKRGAAKYLVYNQMVSFGDLGTYQITDDNNKVITKKLSTSGSVQFPEYDNARGSYFTMLSDSYGEQGTAPVTTTDGQPTLQELKIGYAYLNDDRTEISAPFYVVWDQVQVPNPSFDQNKPTNDPTKAQPYLVKTSLVGKFTQSPTWKFSLLNYVQTRNSASSLSGAYKPEDFYNFPRGACDSELKYMADDSSKPCIKTPKLVGILFTNEQGKQVLKEVFYQNQRCPVTLQSKDVFSASYVDAAGKMIPITVKLESSQAQDSPITAHWLSITDGAKILDFAHEPLVWDTSPMRDDIVELNNLDNRKRRTWKLNVSGFVSNPVLNASWKMSPGIHNNALATNLNAVKKVGFGELVACKSSLADSIQREINKGLASIWLDDTQPSANSSNGQLYLPHAPTGKASSPIIKRYVYTFGSNELEKNLSFYDEGLDGWSVDLNNGILYEPATQKFGAYPAGVSIQASHLAELLGLLRLYVDRDTQGNPKGLGIANCLTKPTPTSAVKSTLKR